MSWLAQAGARMTVPPCCAKENAISTASSMDAARSTGTRPWKTSARAGAASPIATTALRLAAAEARGARSTPLASPPAMRTASCRPSSAARAACGLVAFESSTNLTDPARATTAPRCGRGANVRSADPTASQGSPKARPAAAAAAESASNERCWVGRIPRSVGEFAVTGSGPPPPEPPYRAGRPAAQLSRDGVVSVPHVGVALGLPSEDPGLGSCVAVEGAVPVQMVGGKVQQDRDLGPQTLLEHQLEGGALNRQRLQRGVPGCQRERKPDVPAGLAPGPSQEPPSPAVRRGSRPPGWLRPGVRVGGRRPGPPPEPPV